MIRNLHAFALALLLVAATQPAIAQQQEQEQSASAEDRCNSLPSHQQLTEVLRDVVEPGNEKANGGLGNHMWAAVVNRAGVVCSVSHSGETFDAQWPGSRAIAAKKAFAANAFSLNNFALSTANLFWPTQPHKPLYGLGDSNPVDTAVLYRGPASAWGTAQDPLVGQRMGGVTLFAGGLALYDKDGNIVGGLGLSGDESCTDHVIAWKVRHALNLDNVPKGVHPDGNDNIILDITTDPKSGQPESASNYGHPECSGTTTPIAKNLNRTHATGPEE